MKQTNEDQEKKLHSTSVLTTVLAIVALGLVSYGCWLAYRPAGFIVPGLLIWIDISRK